MAFIWPLGALRPYGFAGLVGIFIGLILLIIGIATTYWLEYGNLGGRMGLFRQCEIENSKMKCSTISLERTPEGRAHERELDASVGMVMSGFGLAMIAFITALIRSVMLYKKEAPYNRKAYYIASAMGIIAGIFIVCGIAVFGASFAPSMDSSQLAYSFVLTTISAIIILFCSILMALGVVDGRPKTDPSLYYGINNTSYAGSVAGFSSKYGYPASMDGYAASVISKYLEDKASHRSRGRSRSPEDRPYSRSSRRSRSRHRSRSPDDYDRHSSRSRRRSRSPDDYDRYSNRSRSRRRSRSPDDYERRSSRSRRSRSPDDNERRRSGSRRRSRSPEDDRSPDRRSHRRRQSRSPDNLDRSNSPRQRVHSRSPRPSNLENDEKREKLLPETNVNEIGKDIKPTHTSENYSERKAHKSKDDMQEERPRNRSISPDDDYRRRSQDRRRRPRSRSVSPNEDKKRDTDKEPRRYKERIRPKEEEETLPPEAYLPYIKELEKKLPSKRPKDSEEIKTEGKAIPLNEGKPEKEKYSKENEPKKDKHIAAKSQESEPQKDANKPSDQDNVKQHRSSNLKDKAGPTRISGVSPSRPPKAVDSSLEIPDYSSFNQPLSHSSTLTQEGKNEMKNFNDPVNNRQRSPDRQYRSRNSANRQEERPVYNYSTSEQRNIPLSEPKGRGVFEPKQNDFPDQNYIDNRRRNRRRSNSPTKPRTQQDPSSVRANKPAYDRNRRRSRSPKSKSRYSRDDVRVEPEGSSQFSVEKETAI